MSPENIAQLITQYRFTKPEGLRLRRWRRQFWEWDGRKYKAIPADFFKSVVTNELTLLKERGMNNQITTALINNVIANLAKDAIPDDQEMPAWAGPKTNEEEKLLTMENGLVSLNAIVEGRPVVVYPHTPNWFSMTELPYKYDGNAQCPRWEEFLYQIFEGDLERIKLVQEWFGYCLTPNTTAQKFLVLEGEGANGKSVVCEILTALLGQDNVSRVPLECFGERFQLVATLGKLVNITTEVGEVKSIAEGPLKQFTAGDPMQFERKGIDTFDAIPTARLVVATNTQPKFVDRSDGVWRRMILIPFNFTVPLHKQDPQLAEKLKAELPGILNWAAAGERRRLKQGGKFTIPKICSDAVAQYKLESNPTKMFMIECLREQQDAFEPSDDIYAEYRDWCKKNGFLAGSRNTFAKEMARVFPRVKKIRRREGGNPITVYMGIRLDHYQRDPERAGCAGTVQADLSVS